MITELALERVEFTCGHCWHRWTADYYVQHYRDEEGTDWEDYSHNGIPVPSPYAPDGAPPCPQCHRHWVGHLTARRLVPLPTDAAGAFGPPHPAADALAAGTDRPPHPDPAGAYLSQLHA